MTTPPSRSWSPPWWRVGGYLLVAAAVLLLAPGDTFPASWVVAALITAVAARDALLRPALVADSDGLRWRTGLGTAEASWSDVLAVRAGTDWRRGLVHLRMLELDLRDPDYYSDPDAPGNPEDAVLVVLSRHRLGADPAAVAAELTLLRARRQLS